MLRGFNILLGPALFLFFYSYIGPFDGMSNESFAIFCSGIWIATWWINEAVPIPLTSLLPLVLFPLTGGLDLSSTSSAYGNKIIFFYMAGFFLAIAMEKWNLHKRIALLIIYYVGTNKKRMVLGFMLATAILSMFLSNTSTSIMMLPIGIAIASQVSLRKNLSNSNFGKVLMHGIAYSASIGGFATLFGTPPNLILQSNIEQFFNYKIDWDDTIIAIFYAILLFIFKSKDKKQKIITWEDSVKLPWGIILLFGGGLSVAAAMQESGLALWFGEKAYLLNDLSVIFIILLIVLAVNFLTEITSNLATVSMILPILATVSISLGINPLIIMISATIAASCAFMLPVATPPNAVVFGSGYLKIKDMIRTGLLMNFISIIIVSLYICFVLPEIWDLESIILIESLN